MFNRICLFFFFYVNTILSQSVSLKKSTLNYVASPTMTAMDHKCKITQSIGQLGAIGTSKAHSITIQQGFLNSVLLFNINNSENKIIEEKLNFSIYPNPFVEYITIKFSKKTNEEIYLYIHDIIGKIYFSKKYLPTNKITIPVKYLKQGNYLLQIRSNKNKYVEKIFKIK